MTQIEDLLRLADAYRAHHDLPDVTVSNRVFADSKKIGMLRRGSDITVGRFNDAMVWFSANWPEGCDWPSGVQRPFVPTKAPETAGSHPAAIGA